MQPNYDAKNNILYVPAKEEVKVKARGFIVTVADTQEELEAIQRGENNKFNISPIFAPNEQVALDHIKNIGKIALSIVPLEVLELQVDLLYNLAKNEKIEILREELFKVEKN